MIYFTVVKHNQTKAILVAISYSHAASRQKLRGIYQYASVKDAWDITLVRSKDDLTPKLLDECANGHFDGFILSSDECTTRISQFIPTATPLIAIEFGTDIPQDRDSRITSVLNTDNVAIGQMAASHFLSLGHFAAFAYIPDEMGREWSTIRGRAFIDTLRANRCTTETYDSSKEGVSEFLLRQKKPVAVFAAWDFIAAEVIRACHRSGLRIPSQVSVIGVDDDDLICESVRPPLSTILVDRVKQGFVAAKTLDAMMSAPQKATLQKYICHPTKVIERESTACVSPGNTVIDRARKFISDHVTGDIGVQDVADAIHVSRRLLDLRFAESGIGTVAEFIRMRRLAAVKQLLKQTSFSDTRIALRCGFKSVGALRNLFRHECGITMKAYRNLRNFPSRRRLKSAAPFIT